MRIYKLSIIDTNNYCLIFFALITMFVVLRRKYGFFRTQEQSQLMVWLLV